MFLVPPGAGADLVDRFFHCGADNLVLAHTEIIVRAPDGYFVCAGFGMAGGARKRACLAFEVGEDAVIAFGSQGRDTVGEKLFIVHLSRLSAGWPAILQCRCELS